LRPGPIVLEGSIFSLKSFLGPLSHLPGLWPDGESLFEVTARGTNEAGVLFFRFNCTIQFLMCLSTFSTKYFNGVKSFHRQTGKKS
jgi:hypothetical protein